MDSLTPMERLLRRSDELDVEILTILDPDSYSPAQPLERVRAAIGLALVANEHGRALRALVTLGLMPSAISLMRSQFEALTRSAWLMWAAKDADIERIQAPLTLETEKAASKLPMLSKMLEEVAASAPPGPSQMLGQFKQTSLASLNSYVHGGIHVLHRQGEGYPEHLVQQIVRNANGLQVMAGMLLAMFGSSQEAGRKMARIQPGFADCLPPLLKP
jgi:hypothetical protein